MRKKETMEPERRVVKKSEAEKEPRTGLQKEFWTSVISHLTLLDDDEALALEFPDYVPPRAGSSVHLAAARVGRRVSARYCGNVLYLWLAGRRKDLYRNTPPRKPIQCKVCGAVIQRPKVGGSKQYVCAGKGGKKSWCQNVWRQAAIRGLGVEEYVEKHARFKSKEMAA